MRDDFLAAATHDLRAPLTGLRGRAQLAQQRLRRGAVDPRWLGEQLDRVCAADRMRATVDELADVARLQIGRSLDLDLDLDLAEVEVGALAGARARARGSRPSAARAGERRRQRAEGFRWVLLT